MRGLRSTLVLVVLFLALLGYLYYQSRRPASPSSEELPKVFAAQAEKIEEVRIRLGSGETTALRKASGTWTLVEPAQAPADQSEAMNIATAIAGLERQRVVDETGGDLKEFGLTQPKIDVGFKVSGEQDLRHLLIGDKTATGGDLYAKLPNEKAVFLVAGYIESTFNRTAFELRDKSILVFDRDKADAIETSWQDTSVRLARSGSDWELVQPQQAPADSGAVEGVLTQLQAGRMLALVDEHPTELKQYGLDKPEGRVTVATGSARATLLIGGRNSEDAVYARDDSRPAVFTVPQALANDLRRSPLDFRRKDMFEFRPFNANRFEVVQGGQALAFERIKGASGNPQDTWKEVAPASRTVDASKLEGALLQFANLRAEAFADAQAPAVAALKNPAATVTVRFDDGKKEERVTFARIGQDVFAGRPDQPGAARLEPGRFDEALKALEALK